MFKQCAEILIISFLSLFFFQISDVHAISSGSSIPVCPYHSSYDMLYKRCECDSGYIIYNGNCISEDQYCKDLYGYNSYSMLGKCECQSGYVLYKSGLGSECISQDEYCENTFNDFHAVANSIGAFNKCKCEDGYLSSYSSEFMITSELKYSSDSCVDADEVCQRIYGRNSSYNRTFSECECDLGYELISGECQNHEDVCQSKYGEYSTYNLSTNTCGCLDGYILDVLSATGGLYCRSQEAYCYEQYGEHSEYQTDHCGCEDGYTMNKNLDSCISMDQFCQEEINEHSYYDLISKTCVCEKGFIFFNAMCIENNQYCKENFAGGSQFLNGSCQCQEGYVNNDGVCVLKTVTTAIQSSYENIFDKIRNWLKLFF